MENNFPPSKARMLQSVLFLVPAKSKVICGYECPSGDHLCSAAAPCWTAVLRPPALKYLGHFTFLSIFPTFLSTCAFQK